MAGRARLRLPWLGSVCGVLLAAACAPTEDPWSPGDVEAEITVFLGDYFQALLDGDPDAVTSVYHPDGASLGSYGRLASYDPAQMRERYEWLNTSPPAELWWDEVHHEVLGRDAVLTTGIIGWLGEVASQDTLWITYTGVLVRTGDGWRVIHEQESTNVGPGG